MEPKEGGKINWKMVLLGGGAVVLVLVLVMKSGGTTKAPAASTPTTASDSATTNAGTPSATSNNSLVGFTDPATGIQWILDQVSGQMTAVGGNGTGLPATYTAGTNTGRGISTVPINIGAPPTWWDYNPSWLNITNPTIPGGAGGIMT
jgi:hypothetical protein